MCQIQTCVYICMFPDLSERNSGWFCNMFIYFAQFTLSCVHVSFWLDKIKEFLNSPTLSPIRFLRISIIKVKKSIGKY